MIRLPLPLQQQTTIDGLTYVLNQWLYRSTDGKSPSRSRPGSRMENGVANGGGKHHYANGHGHYDGEGKGAEHPHELDRLTLWNWALIALLAYISYATIPEGFVGSMLGGGVGGEGGRATLQHVWYFGWITALSTGLGTLPFVVVSEMNKWWLGVSNGACCDAACGVSCGTGSLRARPSTSSTHNSGRRGDDAGGEREPGIRGHHGGRGGPHRVADVAGGHPAGAFGGCMRVGVGCRRSQPCSNPFDGSVRPTDPSCQSTNPRASAC